jgi:hypothetical protein
MYSKNQVAQVGIVIAPFSRIIKNYVSKSHDNYALSAKDSVYPLTLIVGLPVVIGLSASDISILVIKKEESYKGF